MGRRVDVDNLVGTTTIANRLGVKPVTVRAWVARHDFPAPVALIDQQTKVWSWPDVERWAKATGRGRT